MNRRSFIRSLGLLAGSTMIPDGILPITNFIEKKTEEPFINHMTIQRRKVTITGRAENEVIWVNYCQDTPAVGFFDEEAWIKLIQAQERKAFFGS